MTGELDGDQLTIDVDYEQAHGEWIVYLDCIVPQSHETLTQFPEPITFTVPASGASLSLVQTLGDITDHPAYELPGGAARITVRPVAPPQ